MLILPAPFTPNHIIFYVSVKSNFRLVRDRRKSALTTAPFRPLVMHHQGSCPFFGQTMRPGRTRRVDDVIKIVLPPQRCFISNEMKRDVKFVWRRHFTRVRKNRSGGAERYSLRAPYYRVRIYQDVR